MSYKENLRYIIAKQKSQTTTLINQLIRDIKLNDLNTITYPLPDFTRPSLKTSGRLSVPASPPRQSLDKFQGDQSPKLRQSQINSSPQFSPRRSMVASEIGSLKKQIPQFYFPTGKPLEQEILEQYSLKIDAVFKSKNELDINEFIEVTVGVCEFPGLLNQIFFNKLAKGANTISKQNFKDYWFRELSQSSKQKRFYNVIRSGEQISYDDWKPLMKYLLEFHQGLEFLKATPEFQERYTDTVIERILFSVDSNDDRQISFRDFKHSNIVETLFLLDKEEDINKIRDYFSYEHFYVLYCRFWELDNDHDFIIDKEDFSRYESHSLSRKAVERIFAQIPRKFRSGKPNQMNYEDFLWFMLCEEDKTTVRSLEYWFKICDLDDNGIITAHEMKFFYEEQQQRLEYLSQEVVQFNDVLCQMYDMIKPSVENQFCLQDFLRQRQQAGTFFNCLLNLNKFINYEQRDPFQQKHEMTENPEFSEWDRFAQQEYIRLAMEEENEDVIDGIDPWDSDQEN